MRVLVTRPGVDAAETGRRLAALGHEAITAPLLRVYFHDVPKAAFEGVQGILLTSANGAHAFAWSVTPHPDLPVFAVGRRTAQAARDAGFSNVRSADGDADALAQAVSQWVDPAKGSLLHAAGAHADGRLATELMSRGFRVERHDVYDVAVAPSELLATVLSRRLSDAALFFSPRSARAFCEFVAVQGLKDTTRGIIAIAMSAATAEALKPLEFREIRVASAPNQDALLACLG